MKTDVRRPSLTLIYSNANGLPLLNELRDLKAQYQGKCEFHLLSANPSDDNLKLAKSGRLNKADLKKWLPAATSKIQILVCGPEQSVLFLLCTGELINRKQHD